MSIIRTGDKLYVGGYEVTPTTIINAYKKYYPKTWDTIASQNKFHFLHLFGIRVSTDNPFVADDIVGGLRITNLNYYEYAISRATTEPGTGALASLYDAEARARGGAAYMKEGQYIYKLLPRRSARYFNPTDKSGWIFTGKHKFEKHAFFCPISPVSVYGWRPDAVVRNSKKETEWLTTHTINGKIYKGFRDSLNDFKNRRPSSIKDSTSRDTCIHRAWNTSPTGMGRADSAGCQVMKDNLVLNTLGDWAIEHINKMKTEEIPYTLFTAEQFIDAQSTRTTTTTTTTTLNYNQIANNLFNAMNGYGSYEQTIYSNLRLLRNRTDWSSVFAAYGTRTLSSGALNPFSNFRGNLTASLYDELSTSEMATVKNILSRIGVTI
jgi:hypothetical protein